MLWVSKLPSPHCVASGGPHIGKDGTFSVVNGEHMLKQIHFFPAGGKPTRKAHIPGRKNWERDEAAEELLCNDHMPSHPLQWAEESGRKQ